MPATDTFSRIEAWLEKLTATEGLARSSVGALLLLVAGLAIAWALSVVVKKLVQRIDRWLPVGGQHDVERLMGRGRAAEVVGRVVFWIVLLVFVMAATEILGLPVVTAWLSGVTSYVPRLLVAFGVALLGVLAGRLVKNGVNRAASSAGIGYAGRLGVLAQVVVVGGTLLVAAEQLGLQVHFVTTLITIVVASMVGAAGLAFGLGGRGVVANILAGHYVRKLYDVGQVIRIEGVEGRILRITPTAVIVQDRAGEVAIPAQDFTSRSSTLVGRGGVR